MRPGRGIPPVSGSWSAGLHVDNATHCCDWKHHDTVYAIYGSGGESAARGYVHGHRL